MRHAIVIVPVGQKAAANSNAANHSFQFETHVWRKGIPDPAITNWDNAIECSKAPPQAAAVTHLYLWGDLTTTQSNSVAGDIPGGEVYFADEGWDRWSALEDMGLIEMPQPLEEWEQ